MVSSTIWIKRVRVSFFQRASKYHESEGLVLFVNEVFKELTSASRWSNWAKFLPLVRARIVSGHLTESEQFFEKCKSFNFSPQVRWKCEPAVLGENLLNMTSVLVLSKFHETPSYYVLIIYIKMFEKIVGWTYVYNELSTDKVFLLCYVTLYIANGLNISLNRVRFVSLV
jgi:hypothetical protein